MYFYIDESGHTRANMFGPEQPILNCGVLSSKVNIDALGVQTIGLMCREGGVSHLHAGDHHAGDEFEPKTKMCKCDPLTSATIDDKLVYDEVMMAADRRRCN